MEKRHPFPRRRGGASIGAARPALRLYPTNAALNPESSKARQYHLPPCYTTSSPVSHRRQIRIPQMTTQRGYHAPQTHTACSLVLGLRAYPVPRSLPCSHICRTHHQQLNTTLPRRPKRRPHAASVPTSPPPHPPSLPGTTASGARGAPYHALCVSTQPTPWPRTSTHACASSGRHPANTCGAACLHGRLRPGTLQPHAPSTCARGSQRSHMMAPPSTPPGPPGFHRPTPRNRLGRALVTIPSIICTCRTDVLKARPATH